MLRDNMKMTHKLISTEKICKTLNMPKKKKGGILSSEMVNKFKLVNRFQLLRKCIKLNEFK